MSAANLAAYIPDENTYRLPETVQWTTLIIAAFVVAIIYAGFRSLWDDWRDRWSIEDAEAEIADMADDLYAGRDQHPVVPMSAGSRWAA